MLTIVIAVSYAYIAYYTRQKEVNVLGTDCIQIEYKEKTNAIHLNHAYPISDQEGKNTNPYLFEITNVCSVGVHYNVNIEVITKQGVDKQEIPNILESKNVATQLDDLEIKRLTGEIATTPTYNEDDYEATESYTIYKGLLKPGETKSHELRLWLHESSGNETQNKNFYSKVVIEGIQNELASVNFSEYIMNKNEVEKITHEETEQTPSLTDYRYTGSNPNNYVYFGCSDNCTEDNLYRIIGVLPTQSSDTSSYKNRVKLIKANYYIEEESGLLKDTNATYPAGGGSGKGYQWNSSTNNQWQTSTLQSEVLNGVYWNSLREYQGYIEQAKWYLGAPTYSSYTTYTPDEFYNIERSNNKGYSGGETNFIGNIGLMYPSDYGYSIGKESQELSIYESQTNYIENAWLYQLENKYYEWTMTPESSTSNVYAWDLRPDGYVHRSYVFHSNNMWGVRPTFYLKEEVIYVGGTGTSSDPYRIGTHEKKFSDYIINERNNDSSIVQVVHEETEQTGLNASIDYRYTGARPNNYVCFGSEATPCPSDNLYRVIGVIPTQSSEDGPYENRVKLIKVNYYTENTSGLLTKTYGIDKYGYNWNANAANKWEESTLQSRVLNGVYWDSLGKYQSYVEQAKWYLGAPDYIYNETYTPEQYYASERSKTQGRSKGAISYINYIGLMYPSDYTYSNETKFWENKVSSNTFDIYKNNAWLFQFEKIIYAQREWTISPEASYHFDNNLLTAYLIYEDGRLSYHYGVNHENSAYGVRPTFYLKTDVQYQSGDGSIENPYRIGL